jgi:hypothetical protein
MAHAAKTNHTHLACSAQLMLSHTASSPCTDTALGCALVCSLCSCFRGIFRMAVRCFVSLSQAGGAQHFDTHTLLKECPPPLLHADVLQHFEAVHGIRMQSLSPFNEPASPAWCLQLNNRQEGCYFSKPRSHKVSHNDDGLMNQHLIRVDSVMPKVQQHMLHVRGKTATGAKQHVAGHSCKLCWCPACASCSCQHCMPATGVSASFLQAALLTCCCDSCRTIVYSCTTAQLQAGFLDHLLWWIDGSVILF